jgi:hypothetical protein
MFVTLIVIPSAAAEEIKTTNIQTASSFIQKYIKNPSILTGDVSQMNLTRSSYDHNPYRRSDKIDVSRYLPVPLEIDSSVPSLYDPEVRLGMDPKWKEESRSCTFGIKYSFSRFELQHFAKSIVSLFSNLNNNAPRADRQPNLPVSFYLSIPEY